MDCMHSSYASYDRCCYEDLLFVFQGQVVHILRNTESEMGQTYFVSICDSTMPVQKGLYTLKTLPSLNELCKGCQEALPGMLTEKAICWMNGFDFHNWLTADLLQISHPSLWNA